MINEEISITFKSEAILMAYEIEQEAADPGMWSTILSILSNSMGSTAMFVINHPLDKFLGIASPALEDGVPEYPSLNDDGEARISTIRFRHAMLGDAQDAVSGAVNDLDEYLRSKVIFRDHMDKVSTYLIGDEE